MKTLNRFLHEQFKQGGLIELLMKTLNRFLHFGFYLIVGLGLYIFIPFRQVYPGKIKHLEFFSSEPLTVRIFCAAPAADFSFELRPALLMNNAGKLGIETAIGFRMFYANLFQS